MIVEYIITHAPYLLFLITIITTLRSKESIWKALERQMLRWLVGGIYIWDSIGHLFEPQKAAESIGWGSSPFQKEVGFYDLAMGIGALLSSFDSFENIRAGVLFIFVIFSFMAGVNHFYELIVDHNNKPNNKVILMWLDLILPVFFVIIYLKSIHKS